MRSHRGLCLLFLSRSIAGKFHRESQSRTRFSALGRNSYLSFGYARESKRKDPSDKNYRHDSRFPCATFPRPSGYRVHREKNSPSSPTYMELFLDLLTRVSLHLRRRFSPQHRSQYIFSKCQLINQSFVSQLHAE